MPPTVCGNQTHLRVVSLFLSPSKPIPPFSFSFSFSLSMGSCCSTSSHRPKLTGKGALRPESSRSRRWRRTSSNPQKLPEVDGIGEEELHNLPKRKFSNGFTEKACLFTQQGRKGTNQDAMLLWEDFGSREDTIFCGVFDGHGPYGHMVAKKVRDSLPLKLCNQWKALTHGGDVALQNGSSGGSMNTEKATSMNIDEEWVEALDGGEEKFPEIYLVLRQALLKASKLMDKELKLHATIDCLCSGTTAVTLVKKGQDLVIGNVGDSRAVLATRDADNSLQAVQLTTDLKPNLPREAARIQQCKGRVFALQDEPEVSRVWLPNSDSPGLAMARAFGDFCLKDYGLISVPDITYRHLTGGDKFIVLATDGVWDVFSNKEVVDIIASAPSRGTAARALVDCAVRAWRLKFPTSKIDDCAVVCLFLNPLSTTQHENNGTVTKKSCEEPLETSPLASIKEHQSMPKCSPPHNSPLENSHTPEIDDEIVPIPDTNDGKLRMRSNSTRSLADCISTGEEEEWSALEGVTRVNSLLNLPRFLSGDKRSASRRKWL